MNKQTNNTPKQVREPLVFLLNERRITSRISSVRLEELFYEELYRGRDFDIVCEQTHQLLLTWMLVETSDFRLETKVFATHSTGSRRSVSIGLSPALSLSPSGWHEAGGEPHVLMFWRVPKLWKLNILCSTKHIPAVCPREKKHPSNDDPKQRQPESVLEEKKTCRTMSEPRGTVIPHFCPSALSTLTILVDHHLYKKDILCLYMTAVWELDHSWFKASYKDCVTQPLTSLSVSFFL